MHKDAHNLTLRRGISEVNSPMIRSDDRRAQVLQGRPLRDRRAEVLQERPQALRTGIEPRLETLRPSEFLPACGSEGALRKPARLGVSDDERGDRRDLAQIEYG
jgi:hypothetical protein